MLNMRLKIYFRTSRLPLAPNAIDQNEGKGRSAGWSKRIKSNMRQMRAQFGKRLQKTNCGGGSKVCTFKSAKVNKVYIQYQNETKKRLANSNRNQRSKISRASINIPISSQSPAIDTNHRLAFLLYLTLSLLLPRSATSLFWFFFGQNSRCTF